MPVTLKTGAFKYRKTDGTYQGINAIAGQTTAQEITTIQNTGAAQVAAVNQKGLDTLASIPDDYTTLTNNVSQLSEEIVDNQKAISNALNQLGAYYPAFYVGIIDVSNGGINTTYLNRAYTDPILTEGVKVFVNAGWDAYLVYYNKDLSFAGNGGNWQTGIITPNSAYHCFRMSVRKTQVSDFTGVKNESVVQIVPTIETVSNRVNELSAKTDGYFCDTFVAALNVSNGGIDVSGVNRVITELIPGNFDMVSAAIGYSYYVVCYNASLEYMSASGWLTETSVVPDCAYYRIMVKNDSISDWTGIKNDYIYVRIEDETGPQGIFTVGENDNLAEVLTEAMRYPDSIVYIDPYEHDIISEWESFYGENYFTNFPTGEYGLKLKNNVHIIGRSGCLLTCKYTGSNDNVMSEFAIFNNPADGSGYTIENVEFDTSKIRYAIHDERGSNSTPYTVRFSRCRFKHDNSQSTWTNSRACIGGGLGTHADVIVEDCVFNTVTSSANMDALAYHNSAGAGQSSIVIKNCYFEGNSTIQLASYGASTKKTKVVVANNSLGSAIEELDWTSGSPNFDYFYINNIVRN